jgi:hypothetical protein
MAVQFVPWLLGGTMIYRYRRRARAHLATSQPETYRWMRRLD